MDRADRGRSRGTAAAGCSCGFYSDCLGEGSERGCAAVNPLRAQKGAVLRPAARSRPHGLLRALLQLAPSPPEGRGLGTHARLARTVHANGATGSI